MHGLIYMSHTLQNRKHVFKMWSLRRIGRINWKQKIINHVILNTDKKLLRTVKQRELRYFEHIKHQHGFLNVLEGKIEGKIPRGGPRNTWIDYVIQWCSTRTNVDR